MRRPRAWLGLVGLVVVMLVLVMLGGSGEQTSPDHRSTSDAYNGTSALRLYAQSLGYSTSSLEGDFELPGPPALLFVFTPGGGFSGNQSDSLKQWVLRGGVLVYASEDWEPQLESKFGLHRIDGIPGGQAEARAPILGGVRRLNGADNRTTLFPFKPDPGLVPLIRGPQDKLLAVWMRVGQGQLIALADPLELCNGYLGKPDNGRFAADLIALTPAGGRVVFDEFHHGARATARSSLEWLTTPWGMALGWTVVVVFIGLALRGRAFGPLVPLTAARDRSTAEYARAVGNLLWRTGARSLTWQTLDAATRKSLGQRIGLAADPNSEHFSAAIRERAPALAGELALVESKQAAAEASEAALLEAAGRMHGLAYPPTVSQARKETE
jgi:hypothetical protein